MIIYGLMNKETFEKEVRELRRRQKAFFHFRKDNPNREKAKERMKEQEAVIREEVEFMLMIRPKGKPSSGEREDFFLAVAEMMTKQREWMKQGGGSWYMNPARDAEKKVDTFLMRWDEQLKEEKSRAMEAEKARQTSLF